MAEPTRPRRVFQAPFAFPETTDIEQPKAPKSTPAPIAPKKKKVAVAEVQTKPSIGRPEPIVTKTATVGKGLDESRPLIKAQPKASTPNRPASTTFDFGSVKIDDAPKIDSAKMQKAATGRTIAENIASNPESKTTQVVRKAVQNIAPPNSIAGNVVGGLLGLEDSLVKSSRPYEIAKGLAKRAGVDLPEMPLETARNIYGENKGYQGSSTLGGIGRGLVLGVAGEVLGGAKGAGLLTGADVGLEQFRQGVNDPSRSLLDVGKESLYQGTKEGVKAGVLNRVLKNSPGQSTVARIAGQEGQGLARGIAGAGARIGLGAAENAITSPTADILFDAGADVTNALAYGDTSASRLQKNRYIQNPVGSIVEDAIVGGGLSGLLHGGAAVKGYKAGGIQEGARSLATGSYEPRQTFDINQGLPEARQTGFLDDRQTGFLDDRQTGFLDDRQTGFLEDRQTQDLSPFDPGTIALPGKQPNYFAPQPIRRSPLNVERTPTDTESLAAGRPQTTPLSRLQSLRREPEGPGRVRDFREPLGFGIDPKGFTNDFRQALLNNDQFGGDTPTDLLSRRPSTDPLINPYETTEMPFAPQAQEAFPLEGQEEARGNLRKPVDRRKLFSTPEDYTTQEMLPGDSDPIMRMPAPSENLESVRSRLDMNNPRGKRTPSGNLIARPMARDFIRASVNDEIAQKIMNRELSMDEGLELIGKRLENEGYAVTPEDLNRVYFDALDKYQPPKQAMSQKGTAKVLPPEKAQKATGEDFPRRLPPEKAQKGTGEDFAAPVEPVGEVDPNQMKLAFPESTPESEPIRPRTVEETSKAQKDAQAYAEPILNRAIEESKSPSRNKQIRLKSAEEVNALRAKRGKKPLPPDEIEGMLRNGVRMSPDTAEWLRDYRKPPVPQETADNVIPFKEANQIRRPTFREQAQEGASPIQGKAPIKISSARPEEPANIAKAASTVIGNRPFEPIPGQKRFSVAKVGTPDMLQQSPMQPGKPITKQEAPIVKRTLPSEPNVPQDDLTGFSPAARNALIKTKQQLATAFEMRQAAMDLNKANPKDIEGGKSRLADEDRNIEQLQTRYNELLGQAQKAQSDATAKRDAALAARQAKLDNRAIIKEVKKDAATIVKTATVQGKKPPTPAEIYQNQKAQYVQGLSKEISTRGQVIDKQVASLDAQIKAKNITPERAEALKGEQDLLIKEKNLHKYVVDRLSKGGDPSELKRAYDMAVEALQDIAPRPTQLAKGKEVTYLNDDGSPGFGTIEEIKGDSVTISTSEGYVTLSKKDNSVSRYGVELPESMTRLSEDLGKLAELDNAKKKTLADSLKNVVRNLPFAGQGGFLGAGRSANPQALKAAVKQFADDAYNYAKTSYKNLNGANFKKALAGDKGVLESAATAINLSKLVSAEGRGADIQSTISWQIMDNALKRPIAAMTDLLLSKATGKRTVLNSNYLGTAFGSILDAPIAAGRGIRAAIPKLGENYLSPEVAKAYKEAKLEGLMGKATVTNPLLRAMMEVDSTMKRGIKDMAIKNEMYLQAYNEYAQLKATKPPNMPSQKAFMNKRLKEMANLVERYSTKQPIKAKPDYELAERIALKAEATAAEGVLQQDNLLSSKFSEFWAGLKEKELSNAGKAAMEGAEFLGRIIWPFIKVRANDAWKKFNYTPPKAFFDFAAGVINKDQAMIADSFARGAIGTGLTMLGWAAYKTLAPPSEFSERSPEDRKIANLNEVSNRGSQDLRIREMVKGMTGGRIDTPALGFNLKIKQWSGIATMLSLGSRLRYEAERERIAAGNDRPLTLASLLENDNPNGESAAYNLVSNILTAGGSSGAKILATEALEHPATSTIPEVLNSFRDEDGISKAVANVASDLAYGVPGVNPVLAVSSKIAKSTDPYKRSGESASRNFTQSIKDKFQQQIPGELFGYGREAMPPRLNAYGQPVNNPRSPLMTIQEDPDNPMLDYMTNLVTGPSGIVRGKDEDIPTFQRKARAQGAGARLGQSTYFSSLPGVEGSRKEIVEGFAAAAGEGKAAAGRDEEVDIDADGLLERIRRAKERQKELKEERGW